MNYETGFPRDHELAAVDSGGSPLDPEFLPDEGVRAQRRRLWLIVAGVVVALLVAAFAYWKYEQSKAATAATAAATAAAGQAPAVTVTEPRGMLKPSW